MKRTTWTALAAATSLAVAVALLAGKEDLCRFRRMQRM